MSPTLFFVRVVDDPSQKHYNQGLPLALGGPMYAVIQTGGKQYRVAPGDTIRIERVDGKVGEKVNFGSVLAVHTDDKKVLLGADAGKAAVTGKIVQQGRAKKDRKSTRLNSSHSQISYAVFCLKKKYTTVVS